MFSPLAAATPSFAATAWHAAIKSVPMRLEHDVAVVRTVVVANSASARLVRVICEGGCIPILGI